MKGLPEGHVIVGGSLQIDRFVGGPVDGKALGDDCRKSSEIRVMRPLYSGMPEPFWLIRSEPIMSPPEFDSYRLVPWFVVESDVWRLFDLWLHEDHWQADDLDYWVLRRCLSTIWCRDDCPHF